MEIEFKPFPKIRRFTKIAGCVITEKLDGTNASIKIAEDGQFLTASRNRWITPERDNYNFSKWAHDNKDELMKLGVGHHFGEWWGLGIQRGYGLQEKRFSLFNVERWNHTEVRPTCCDVVPVLGWCEFTTEKVDEYLGALAMNGSVAAPGFMNPEGIVVYYPMADLLLKKTFKNDPKGEKNE